MCSLYLTDDHSVHAGTRAGLSNSLRDHSSQLRLHLTPDPTDQVPAPPSKREAHPGHRADLLPVLAAVPHGQHSAGVL